MIGSCLFLLSTNKHSRSDLSQLTDRGESCHQAGNLCDYWLAWPQCWAAPRGSDDGLHTGRGLISSTEEGTQTQHLRQLACRPYNFKDIHMRHFLCTLILANCRETILMWGLNETCCSLYGHTVIPSFCCFNLKPDWSATLDAADSPIPHRKLPNSLRTCPKSCIALMGALYPFPTCHHNGNIMRI